MLMDLFFHDAPLSPKRRVHFHEFMGQVHDRLDTWRKMSLAERRKSEWRTKGDINDPVPPVAKQVAAEAQLLCFDEFQVTQITDAMILGRLFTALFERGVTMVATSNRHPDDLYTDGINRQLFLPFIGLLKQRCDVFELASDRDYRLDRLTEAPVWYSPLNEDAHTALQRALDTVNTGR